MKEFDDKYIPQIISILRRETKSFRDPSVTEIANKYKDPFFILISCILSLRTKDKTTRCASERLFKLAGNPYDMLKLSQRVIQKAIYPVGFYREKSKNILSICKDIIEKFKGCVPSDLEGLLSLRGVGLKTANLVLGLGFKIPAICVDTHVHRLSNRWGYISTKSPEETERALRMKLPKRYWIEFNDLLVIWGQNICRPIRPLCSRCAIDRLCCKIIRKLR